MFRDVRGELFARERQRQIFARNSCVPRRARSRARMHARVCTWWTTKRERERERERNRDIFRMEIWTIKILAEWIKTAHGDAEAYDVYYGANIFSFCKYMINHEHKNTRLAKKNVRVVVQTVFGTFSRYWRKEKIGWKKIFDLTCQ